MNPHKLLLCAVAFAVVVVVASPVLADPLPGEVLKFQQTPMVATQVEGVVYPGHDELSTANLIGVTPGPHYEGVFMADDFADKFSTPVVHVQWWGSYLNPPTAAGRVNKFLISFESDVPADPAGGFSHPGVPLLSQVVSAGPLAPASGTFTETPVATPPNAPEPLFKYNAELRSPFQQRPDTVYWMKIVALVDPQTDGPIQWGWHNRDYTVFDPLASAPPLVVPGEHVQGILPLNQPIWHFQDDAVSGVLPLLTIDSAGLITMQQSGFTPQHYVFPTDGPDVIGQFSKDLAFNLYTVPEPGTLLLLAAGGLGILATRRRRKA